MTKTKKVERKIARRADNGRITTLDYAKKHPDKTVIETRTFKYKIK